MIRLYRVRPQPGVKPEPCGLFDRDLFVRICDPWAEGILRNGIAWDATEDVIVVRLSDGKLMTFDPRFWCVEEIG